MENNATEVCPDSNSATLKDENDEEKYCGVKISAFEIPSGATTLKISQSESSRNLISESQSELGNSPGDQARKFSNRVFKPEIFRPGEKFNFEPGTRPGFEIQPGN